jgi:3-deoxy-manno-octulosonate cytidylyltransferase (CMP-KDO synthetase)
MRVVIPARYASTRFPGKVLKPIAGKPLLEHVYARAVSSGEDFVAATPISGPAWR